MRLLTAHPVQNRVYIKLDTVSSIFDTSAEPFSAARNPTPPPRVSISMPRSRTCRQCRYSLAGLPTQCTCPECGLYDDGEYDYRSVGQRLRAFPRDLARALRDASPWFAERYLPSLRTAATTITVLGYSAVLVTIGVVTADALTGCFGLLRRRAATMPNIPAYFTEALTATAHWAPLFLAVYAFATAYQGIVRHRINITTSATITGLQARAFGLFALAAAIALAGLFAWVRIATP